MKLFDMVFQKRRFKRVAVGLNGAVDVHRAAGAECTGSGHFMESVSNIAMRADEDSPKVHHFPLIFWSSAGILSPNYGSSDSCVLFK